MTNCRVEFKRKVAWSKSVGTPAFTWRVVCACGYRSAKFNNKRDADKDALKHTEPK